MYVLKIYNQINRLHRNTCNSIYLVIDFYSVEIDRFLIPFVSFHSLVVDVTRTVPVDSRVVQIY